MPRADRSHQRPRHRHPHERQLRDAAIHAVFGDHAKDIAVVSTKSMTGHLLGGAGGIEAVFTALALRDQFAPPTIHYEQPDRSAIWTMCRMWAVR